MQNKITHLIVSLMQMRQHVLKHLSKTLKNVELKTLNIHGSVAQVCENVSQCIICINECNISATPICPKETK